MILIPYSDGTYESVKNAPREIIKQFENIYSNESFKKVKLPIAKESAIQSIPKDTIYIGGDHTITYHILKQHPTEGLLIFDAHPDVFQLFEKPGHQDFLKFVIEENIIPPENIIVVGIRNPDPEEISYYKEKNITFFTCKDLELEDACDVIMERLNKLKSFHLSIDIDVLDPAFAPGVYYSEPGGLTTRQLLYFIQRIKSLKNLNSLDLVEVNPDKDINDLTSKTAAKIIAEFL